MTAVLAADHEYAALLAAHARRQATERLSDRYKPQVVRELRSHRLCAPERAQLVVAECMRDASVLPRYHQDDRGQNNAVKGIHVLAPAGAYSKIPVWQSRQHWLESVVPRVLALHEADRKRFRFSADLFMRWARVKSGYALHRTGRQCIVRPKVLASTLGVSERSVKKMNEFARLVGLEQVVLEGRMLNVEETHYCRASGSRQRGLATEVALTIPAGIYPQAVSSEPTCFTPTSGQVVTTKPLRKSVVLRGLTAKKKEPAPPALRQKRARTSHPAMKLARELAQRVVWLSGEQPGRMAPALTRFAAAGWTAEDVALAIDDANTRRQIAAPTQATIRTRPAVVLAALLRQLDVDADQPSKFEPTPTPPSRRRAWCDDCADTPGWVKDSDGAWWACEHSGGDEPAF